MSSKLVVVVGATGVQGGSVVDAFLKDSSFKVRALTRNPESDGGKALKAKGAEVVAADLNDEASLVKAFDGAYAIYAITNFFEPFSQVGVAGAQEIEYAQATHMVKAAKQIPTLQHYIWSTLPNTAALSNGKHSVPFFDTKSTVDDYIRQDPEFLAKTTFVYLTFYSSNMFYPVFIPIHVKSVNKYIQILPTDATTPISSLGDAKVNVGIFIRAIVKNPPKVGGTYVRANYEDLDFGTYLAKWGEGTGLATQPGSTEVVQIPIENYKSIWPGLGDAMGEMIQTWVTLREKSWQTPLGTMPVDVLEFMSEEDKKDLVSTVEAFRRADFSQSR